MKEEESFDGLQRVGPGSHLWVSAYTGGRVKDLGDQIKYSLMGSRLHNAHLGIAKLLQGLVDDGFMLDCNCGPQKRLGGALNRIRNWRGAECKVARTKQRTNRLESWGCKVARTGGLQLWAEL